MSERLKGQFVGCPYHDDDYEACIQYSGQAPCDPPDGWQLVPVEPTPEMVKAGDAARDHGDGMRAGECMTRGQWRLMLAAAPTPASTTKTP